MLTIVLRLLFTIAKPPAEAQCAAGQQWQFLTQVGLGHQLLAWVGTCWPFKQSETAAMRTPTVSALRSYHLDSIHLEIDKI